jgi:hypothetical protein
MMMNLFLWGLLFTLTTGIFTYTTLLTSAARTFESLDVSLAQSSVVAIGDGTNPVWGPYFDEMLFKSRVKAYFIEGLGSYFEESDYALNFTFSGYRYENLRRDPVYPTVARVDFKVAILDLYTYQNKRTFTIVPGERYVA